MRCARPCTPIPPLHACSMLTRCGLSVADHCSGASWSPTTSCIPAWAARAVRTLGAGIGRARVKRSHVVAAALCPGVLRAPVPPSLQSCGGGSRSVVHVHGLRPAAFAERLSCAMSVGLAASARICMYGADVGLACRRPCESYAASAEHMCKCLLYVPVSSRWGSSLVSRPNYMRERVEKVVRPSRTRSLSSGPSAPGLIERQTSNFRHASLRSVCVASCPARMDSGALATGRTARWPTSRWRWRQGSVSGASP